MSFPLLHADAFADKAHAGQFRKGASDAPQIPYIEHPRAVARILSDEAGIADNDILVSALLHDTIEDCGVSRLQLQEIFGAKVADVVVELTNGVTEPSGKLAMQIAHAKTMSAPAAAVKVADKIANLRDLINSPPDWSNDRKMQYFKDAREVVYSMSVRHPVLEHLFEKVYASGISLFPPVVTAHCLSGVEQSGSSSAS